MPHLTSSSSPVNSFIQEAIIKGCTTDEEYEKDGYAIKRTFVNDLELIFVIANQRIQQLTYVNHLMAVMKALFLMGFVASLHTMWGWAMDWNFTKVFDR